MKNIPIFWVIFPAALVIIVSGLVLVTRFSTSSFWDFYLRQTEDNLEARGKLIIRQLRDHRKQEGFDNLQSVCESMGSTASSRITVIQTDGVVLCDSEKDPGNMDNHRDRLEIQDALSGRTGVSVRYSQ